MNSKKECSKYGTIIKIAYNPDFSTSLKSFCKQNVSEENKGNDTSQYSIESLLEEAQNMEYEILPEDMKIIISLDKKNVEYIEI